MGRTDARLYLRQPLIIRLTHWPFAGMLLLVLASGLYLHAPARQGIPIPTVNIIHQSAGFAALGLFVIRVYYAITKGDFRNILVTPRDLIKLPSMLAYAVFLRQTAPPYPKYNPGQKLIYSVWAVTFVVKVLMGVALIDPARASLMVRPFGLNGLRIWKYYLTLAFLASILLHIYQGITESRDNFKAMFTGRVKYRSDRDPAAEEESSDEHT